MHSYQQQQTLGTTIFRAANLKAAMSEARVAFGPDVEVMSVERVGQTYCVEVRSPGVPRAGAPSSPATALVPQDGARQRAGGNFDSMAIESVERLERRFEQLASRVELARGHQGAGLEAIGTIRSTLMDMGFSEPFLSKLAGAIVDSGVMAFSKDVAMKIMASWLAQLGEAPDMSLGWHAVVGPAGSGKTTTIAKLASRAAASLGSDSVGLVTTDFFRIGAYEQLRVFGELLGIKVHLARSPAELVAAHAHLAGKKVVYVDTVGSTRDDEKMREQMGMLGSLDITATMALQACLSGPVMRVDLGRWRDAGATAAIITKLDQAVGASSLVESLIMRGVPARYATNGQRVPADLHRVSSLLLAHKALRVEGAPVK